MGKSLDEAPGDVISQQTKPAASPAFPLPKPALPSPLKRKNAKHHSETEERNDQAVFLLEYI